MILTVTDILALVILGYIIGFISIIHFYKKKFTIGTFVIDSTNIDKDLFTVEVDSFDNIDKMKYIIFKVKNIQ